MRTPHGRDLPVSPVIHPRHFPQFGLARTSLVHFRRSKCFPWPTAVNLAVQRGVSRSVMRVSSRTSYRTSCADRMALPRNNSCSGSHPRGLSWQKVIDLLRRFCIPEAEAAQPCILPLSNEPSDYVLAVDLDLKNPTHTIFPMQKEVVSVQPVVSDSGYSSPQ